MFALTYIGPLSGVRKDEIVFMKGEPVEVSEDIAMLFADSPDFEQGELSSNNTLADDGQGEEE